MLIETKREQLSDISLGDIVAVQVKKNLTKAGVVIRIISEFNNGVKKNYYEVVIANRHEKGFESIESNQEKIKKIGVKKMNLQVGDKVTVYTGEDFIDVKITKINRTKKGVIKDIEGENKKGQFIFRKENIAGFIN